MKLKAVTMEKSPCPKDAIKRLQLSSLLMSSYIKMGNCCLFLKLLLPRAFKLACVLASENYDSQELRDLCFKKATILKEKTNLKIHSDHHAGLNPQRRTPPHV